MLGVIQIYDFLFFFELLCILKLFTTYFYDIMIVKVVCVEAIEHQFLANSIFL